MFRHKIIRSALILTAANIITRILGFFYRIFMSKTIGAEGMGLYQLISPVYMLVWAFSSAGLSTSVSKLTAEQKGSRNPSNMYPIVKCACIFSVVLSLIASVAVYYFSPYICTRFLKDSRTVLSLRILCVCFPFMAVGSCIRGWFYGIQEAKVPAACQVLEQCTRMAVVYFLSFKMLGKGLEAACAMAVIGMAAGEVISFVYVLVCSLLKPKHKEKATLSYFSAASMIFALALPLTLNRITGSLLSTVENLLIPSRLQLYGLTRSNAVALYGQLCGMAMPLIMFPSSLLTSLATALMPAVSEASAKGNMTSLSSSVEKSLAFTAVTGIGTAGLFICLPYELGSVIYSQHEIGYMLRLLGIICPFIYLQVTLGGILNGLGKQVFIFGVNLAASAFNICFIWLFVPKYGIEAFILGWFISIVTAAILSLFVISHSIKIRLYLNNILIKPLAAIIFSSMSLKFFSEHLDIGFFSTPALICAMLFIGGMYTALVTLLGAMPLRPKK